MIMCHLKLLIQKNTNSWAHTYIHSTH